MNDLPVLRILRAGHAETIGDQVVDHPLSDAKFIHQLLVVIRIGVLP